MSAVTHDCYFHIKDTSEYDAFVILYFITKKNLIHHLAYDVFQPCLITSLVI